MILSTHYHVRRFIRVNDVQILKTSPHSAHLRKDSHLITEKKKQIFYRKPPQNLTNLQFSCKMLSNTSIKAVFHQTFIRQCGSRTRNVWEPINLDISSQWYSGFLSKFSAEHYPGIRSIFFNCCLGNWWRNPSWFPGIHQMFNQRFH